MSWDSLVECTSAATMSPGRGGGRRRTRSGASTQLEAKAPAVEQRRQQALGPPAPEAGPQQQRQQSAPKALAARYHTYNGMVSTAPRVLL